MRHSKGAVLLAELMIAILFFSLSAAIAVGVLTGAYQMSREATDGERALNMAQEAAESIAAADDLDALLASYAMGFEEDGLILKLTCEKWAQGGGLLYQIALTVSRGETALVELPASRYVPAGKGAA